VIAKVIAERSKGYGRAMTKSCLAVRHVAFEDLGLLGPLLSARGYDIRYHEAGIERFDAAAQLDPRKLRDDARKIGPVLREIGSKVLSNWLDAVAGAAA
jgi:hypothetical protein